MILASNQREGRHDASSVNAELSGQATALPEENRLLVRRKRAAAIASGFPWVTTREPCVLARTPARHGIGYGYCCFGVWLRLLTRPITTPIGPALVSGEPARLSAMIEADKRRLPTDENGVTVLHRALHVYSAQRLEMVRLLIAAGSDVNAVTHEGATPLHWAGRFGFDAAVPLLLKAGARVDARDEDGATPLFFANVPNPPKVLIAAGADAIGARSRRQRSRCTAMRIPSCWCRASTCATPPD